MSFKLVIESSRDIKSLNIVFADGEAVSVSTIPSAPKQGPLPERQAPVVVESDIPSMSETLSTLTMATEETIPETIDRAPKAPAIDLNDM